MGVAVKVTEPVLHTGLDPVVMAMLTEAVACGVTVIAIAELVAAEGTAQVALEVSTHRMRSPLTKFVPAIEVYVLLVAPEMLLPFLVHW